ncbi:MAG: hypothetical protein L0Z68_08960 [Gammaproteobacteria bacterium]|nr:hypothetical protein [Gammaproteobacteria bacterium]
MVLTHAVAPTDHIAVVTSSSDGIRTTQAYQSQRQDLTEKDVIRANNAMNDFGDVMRQTSESGAFTSPLTTV